MKHLKRTVTLLLCSFMLLGTFAACKEGDSGASTGSVTTSGNGNSSNESMYVAEYLPDTTYDGRKFTVGNMGDAANFVITQEDATNTFSKSKYERNKLIESRYKIEFAENIIGASYDETYLAYMNNYMAESYSYDICKNIMRNAWLAAVGGAVVPVDNLEYCDTEQPWYLKYVNEELTINDTLFFAYTYEADTVTRALLCVFFNKKILSETSGLEDPYTLVDNGTWTIDKMHEMAEDAMKDLDGNGKVDNIDEDIFGIITEDDMYSPSLWVGAGRKMIEKDEDGFPYLSAAEDDTFIDILQKCYDYYVRDGVVYEGFSYRGQTAETISEDNKSFTQDHSLFYMGGIYQWEAMTDMESDFGIVPLPKYDERQETYYSRVCDGHANCVPTVNPDLSFTSVILEALAVESLNIVNPAYFEDAIENRYLRDPEQSMDIIKMMQANIIVDLGDTIWMAHGRNIIITECYRKFKNTFASTLDSYTSTINQVIGSDIQKLTLVIESYR